MRKATNKKTVIKWENVLIIPVMIELIIWTCKSNFEVISFIISCLLISFIYNLILLIRKKELAQFVEKLLN